MVSDNNEVDILVQSIYETWGYDFRNYAPASLLRRVKRCAQLAGLSVPDLTFPTKRYPWARSVGRLLDGTTVEVVGEDVLAEALQHEQDHLDGRLYLTRLEPEVRKEAMREVRRAPWFR